MRRMLWLGVGLAVGALVVRAVTKKAQSFTPQAVTASARDSAVGLIDSVRAFVDDVRDGMAEREAEIQAAFIDGVPVDADVAGGLPATANYVGGDFGDTTTQEGMRYR